MLKFAANLSMMFNEVPFLDRFSAAADAGFQGVEYLFPYEFPVEAIAERLRRPPPGERPFQSCSRQLERG
jgi:hydroxypyruvate isomerase